MIAVSTGLMNIDYSGATTENSTICVLFLIVLGDPLVFVTLTATFLSNIVKIECEISRLAVSVKLPTGVTVTVVFQSDG